MSQSNRSREWAGRVGGALLAAATGAALIWFPLGEGFAEWSYDLPFLWRSHVRAPAVAIVYIDRESMEQLGQTGWPMNRRLHVELLRRLTRDGARLVFYDVLFRTEHEADDEFAEAIRQHGKVVLGSFYQTSRHQSGGAATALGTEFKPPNPKLRQAAAGWGLLMLRPLDYGFGARKIFTGLTDDSGLPGQAQAAVGEAARLSGAATARDPSAPQTERWLNFYGPPGVFDQVRFSQALAPDGVAPGFFKDKVVFIGSHPSVTTWTQERDVFASPYSRWGLAPFTPGVQMLATAYANLAGGEWLERMATGPQLLIVILWGVGVGAGGLKLRPWVGALATIVAAGGIAALASYVQWHEHVWWPWLVPAAVQTPLALVWSVGYQRAVLSRQGRRLRRAFAAYLSPHLADRIAESSVDLTLGGKEVEATILFTDLEGFTPMAETLPPAEVSRLLITYFNRTTRCILREEGTIIKYVGDAVMAVWGAPLDEPRHAERAVRAACAIIAAGRPEVAGRKLRTRIGINTGLALAGNLGSDFRFDYTVIGATTNLASRLEGLNKVFGTDILIGAGTRRQLSGQIHVRALGDVMVKGFTSPCPIYEVLGTADSLPATPAWAQLFARALELLAQQQPAAAEALLREVIEARGGTDGPATCYLEHIAAWRRGARENQPWPGCIDFSG